MNQSPLQFNPKGASNPTKTTDLGQFEVICRVRPLQPPQTASDIAVNQDKPTITITQQAKNISKEFSFHKLYKEDSTQAQFTKELADAIFDNCRINEKGSLILSYGVTNSGKTFTILGTEQEPGLLPIIVEKALQQFPNSKLQITAIEAYNDEFYSLQNRQKLLPKEIYGTYQFDDYQPEEITLQSIKTMIKLYIKNRSQCDTRANKNSSRSHAIFKIDCEALSVAIVDLAGSERLNKASTNVHETSSINTSLLVLGRCIHAFRDHNVVPFRQSKLTRALAEYFNSMYKIFMVAHINRSGEMFHQNINVLEYAAVSMTVRHLNPQVNRSILKSARKKSLAAKSNIKAQGCESENSIIKQSEVQKTGQGKKKLKKVEIEQDVLEKMIHEDLQKKKRMAMEIYISQMIAKMDDFDYYLDCQFEVQNAKDEEFLKEIRNTKYVSPSKEKNIRQSVIEAENRIRIRKEILEEIQKEKISQRSDAATEMGPSMKKCLEESIRRRPPTQKEEQSQDLQQRHDPTITPAKTDGLQEDQSLLQKILSKSKTIFKSTTKAIEHAVYSLRELSRKKQSKRSVQKRKPNLNIANQQVNEMFQQKKAYGQKAISSEANDFIRLLQKIDNASNTSGQQTSFLLDSLSQSEDQRKIKVYFNHEANLKQKLVEVRESQEFNQHKNSPFFKMNSELEKEQKSCGLQQEQKSKIQRGEKDSTFEESINNSKTIEHQVGQRKDIEQKSVRSVVTTENGDSKHNKKKGYNKIPQPLHFTKVIPDTQAVRKFIPDIPLVSPVKTRRQRKQGKNTRIA